MEKYTKSILLLIHFLNLLWQMWLLRKNSHETFGFNLMVDSDLNVWLLEVNSSPCMEYSPEIIKKWVKLVMEDTLKVVLDYPGQIIKDSDIDTGLWTLIHKGKYIEQNHSPPGLN
jgi:hypothetical protein